MNNRNKLSLAVAAAAILAMSFGTSAFAESRHRGGTHSSSGSHSWSGSRPSSGGHFFSRGSGGHSAPRFESRSFGSRGFGSRLFGSRGSGGHSAPRVAPRVAPRISPSWRGSGYGRSVPSYRNYNDGHRFYGQGRIERIVPYHGGYNVWLGGWGYPFFVPYRYWSPFRFRVGLFFGFNAFYDPLGYYSVYGWPGYYPPPAYGVYRDGGRSYDDDSIVRGTVQSVDLQTGLVVINDDSSRRTVTALLPPRDNRVDDIRPGDYIELSGDWVRGRQYEFDADRMDRLDPHR